MNADGKLLVANFAGFDKGLEMNSALAVIVPAIFVELQVLAAIIYLPLIPEPARINELGFEVPKYALDIFHLDAPDSDSTASVEGGKTSVVRSPSETGHAAAE